MSQSADRVPTHIGRFVVESVLGAGGMGAVYKATDPTLKRTVAVKTVRPDISEPSYLQRLVSEAQACARLHHPNIVMVHEAGEIDGGAYVVMEYLEGEDLAQALYRGELSFDARVKMLIDILEALEHAHANGVVHRDIKPANVRVLPNGNIKIVDFGLARMTMVDARTQTGVVMGTLHYMSPEQMRGEKVDGRTDIYATGTMAFEMCSGRKPFDGDTISAIIVKVLQEPVPAMDAQWSKAFPEIEKIISRAMAKNAADRYQSAEDMKNALTAFLASSRDRIASNAAHDTVVVQQTLIGAQTLIRDGKEGDARALLEETLKRLPHAPGVRETLAGLPPAQGEATVFRSAGPPVVPQLQQSSPAAQSGGTWGSTPGSYTATINNGGQAPPAPAPPQPAPKPKPWLVPAAAVIALSVIGAASYMMMTGNTATPETTIASAEPAPATGDAPPASSAAPPTNAPANPTAEPAANPPATDLVPKVAPPAGKTEAPKPAATPNAATPAAAAATTAPPPPPASGRDMFYANTSSSDGPNTGLRYRVTQQTKAGTEADVDIATATFRAGDKVRLSFESNVDGYLYVVQQGSSGRWSVLFPNPDINFGRNTVRKSEEYRVPDDGWFEFDSNPGVENLFVYFSKEPMQSLPGFGKPVTKAETLNASAVSELQGTIASRDLSFARDSKPAVKGGNVIQANYVVNKSELGKAVSASLALRHEP